ncbi:MAG: aminodeoxychorismate/anthranilate synthase component II [Ignavibacteriales bacterium]|nr:MAG: aminodeoxychorismate/anthranilate synthase component II [Ignavibacteriales bacterium]
MKILVIDNYDSFTYNLVQLLGRFNHQLIVKRNDDITEDEIAEMKPDKILISPGPGKPENSKISLTAIEKFGKNIPLLGVCLGHQAIGVVFGGKVVKAPILMHGKISLIKHDAKTIFKDIPQQFEATRYHSLIVDRDSIPGSLEISAETDNGIIMGVRHKNFPVEGIQFHPESILTNEGYNIIKNWLSL